MRKGVVRKFSILFCLLFAVSVLPIAAPAAETVKIGTVDIQKVLNESQAGKKAKKQLESMVESKQSVIDEKSKAIEQLKADLEKQASVLSADALKNKQDELGEQIRDYQRLVQDSQADIKKKEGELTNRILQDIRDLVAKMGKEGGYTLILEPDMVPYSSEVTDITDSVLKRFDASGSK